jgi:hypothetical protein
VIEEEKEESDQYVITRLTATIAELNEMIEDKNNSYFDLEQQLLGLQSDYQE